MHAHQHLVIHRDLKPSNILVRDDGTVKLLDFGIAKQLEQLDEADRTQTGLRLMTPAYAAPEQVRGDPVGVYTDVYSLGVVLYELLAGRLPFDLSTRTPGEMERDDPRGRTRSGVGRGRVEWRARRPGEPRRTGTTSTCSAPRRCTRSRRGATRPWTRSSGTSIISWPVSRSTPSRTRSGTAPRGSCSRNRRSVAAAAGVVAVMVAALNVFYAVRLTRARDVAVAEAARTGRIQRFVTQLFQGGDQAAAPPRASGS